MSELGAHVASGYARLDLPSWPDPQPWRRRAGTSTRASPVRSATGSRTPAGAIRAAVLEDAAGTRAQRLRPDARERGPAAFDRGVRLTPAVPGALPLLLLERDAALERGDGTLAVLQIAVVRPDVVVVRWTRDRALRPLPARSQGRT